MTQNGTVRASVSATLAEIERAHAELGLPVEAGDLEEALEIIARIDRRLAANFGERVVKVNAGRPPVSVDVD